MNLEHFRSAEEFLDSTRTALELNEAANSLMLGICGVLMEHPNRYPDAPCLKAVSNEGGLVLAALMTPPHNLIVYHHQANLRKGAETLIAAVVNEGWTVPGTVGLAETTTVVAEVWAEHTGSPTRVSQRLRAYELRQVEIPPPPRGQLRLAMEDDVDQAAEWYYAFQQEIHGQADKEEARRAACARIEARDIFLWDDGRAVSIAMQNRPTRRGISVGLVYTPPELRRRGYATACVSELSRLLLASGWEFCALFADLDNPISNGIYLRIGYKPVCDYHEIRFEKQAL